MRKDNPVESDVDVEKTISWLYGCSENESELRARVDTAAEYYFKGAHSDGYLWPTANQLIYNNDLIAFYIMQAEALLGDRCYFDIELGTEVIAYFKRIGLAVNEIKKRKNIKKRIQRLLNPKSTPKNYLFELAIMAKYLDEGYDIDFVEESNIRTADLNVNYYGVDVNIECKLFSQFEYSNMEYNATEILFNNAREIIISSKLNLHIHFDSISELMNVPKDYIFNHVSNFINYKVSLWKDEYGSGEIKVIKLDNVIDELKDSSLLYGPKLNRLLTGIKYDYHTLIIGTPDKRSNRFIEEVFYASSFTWTSKSPTAIEKKARHIRSKLRNIDDQLALSPLAIAHIGLTSPLDFDAADLKQKNNIDNIMDFNFKSKIISIYLHYIIPRVSESKAWMIDETVDDFHRGDLPFHLLKEPLLFPCNDDSINSLIPAWKQDYL